MPELIHAAPSPSVYCYEDACALTLPENAAAKEYPSASPINSRSAPPRRSCLFDVLLCSKRGARGGCVQFRSNFAIDVFDVPSGGDHKGVRGLGIAQVAAVADLDRAISWEGATASIGLEGPFQGRPESRLSIGINQALLSGGYRAVALGRGDRLFPFETGVEATYSDQSANGLMVQPDFQYIRLTRTRSRET